ncbi:MAG: TetR/AcrR family transcriptional regulator [Pseudomonadota bacterium]
MTRNEREERIAAAAYEVLAEKGFGGASMLAVAKRARASNETLYKWYGDKVGLFSALIRANAAEARALLEGAPVGEADNAATLRALAPVLLDLVTSERAVALNRAAAADATGALGQALAAEGRETVAPLIGQVMAAALKAGELRGEGPEALADLYISLVIGDWQIRRATRVMGAPTPEAVSARAKRGLAAFFRLAGP